MRHLLLACAAALVGAVALLPQPAAAQASNPSGAAQSTTAGTQEIYEAHFVKAAPGKLSEMIDGYLNAPQDPDAAAPPLVLRHVEGDDWDLLILTPYGKEEKFTSATPSATVMQWIQRMRPLRAMHTDTVVIGPTWSDTRAALAGSKPDMETAGTAGTSGTSGDKSVYVVTTLRALPGHRDQLAQVLNRIAALTPGRTITMQHMEGSAWDFVTVTRYPSWAAFADNESQPDVKTLSAQGFSGPGAPALALREHLAEHHDTLAVAVERK